MCIRDSFYTVRPQIPLQIVNFYLLRVEDGRGQPGIHNRVVAEQLQKVLLFAGTAGGDDGHGAAGGHGIEQLKVKAVFHAVRVNGVYDQLPRAVFYALFEPVKGCLLYTSLLRGKFTLPLPCRSS